MNVRKNLIPVVAGLFISPALMAADLDGPTSERIVGNEYLSVATAGGVVDGDALGVTLGSEYAVGDILTLTFTGSALDGATVPGSITVAVDNTGGAELNGITVGLLSADSGTAVYRVTDIVAANANPTTIGVTIPFAAADVLEFDAQSVAVAGVTVSYAAETDSGLALDTGGGALRSSDYLELDDQFEVVVTTGFDGVIDVENNRLDFVSGDIDILTITHSTNAIDTTADATLVDADYTVFGDFSWIYDTADPMDPADITFGGTTVVVGGAGCGTLVVTASEISYTCDGTPGATTLTFDVGENVDDNGDPLVLPVGAFTASVIVNFTGIGAAAGTTAGLSGAAAGAWTLNGYQALIPYMPYGVGISQVIYLANRGIKAGDVTVEWIDKDGTSGSLGIIGILGAGTTMKIGQLIQNALPMAQQTSGRLALTVTANVPAQDVQMNSQYNVSGNRAFTLHEDNRPTPSH